MGTEVQQREQLEHKERLQRAYADLKLDRRAEQRIIDAVLINRPRSKRPLRLWYVPASVATVCAGALLLFFWPGMRQYTPSSTLYQSEDRELTVKESDYTLQLAPHSQLVLERRHPGRTIVNLQRGEVSCSVDKLQGEQRFKVATAHLEVRVVGTRFKVHTQQDRTEVDLSEGEVFIYRYHGIKPVRMRAPERRRFFGDRGEALMQLALERVAEADDEQAVELLERYRGMFPKGLFLQDALFHLSVLYERMGEHKKAKQLAQELARRWPERARTLRLQQGQQPKE